jgi:hypothetical protein
VALVVVAGMTLVVVVEWQLFVLAIGWFAEVCLWIVVVYGLILQGRGGKAEWTC